MSCFQPSGRRVARSTATMLWVTTMLMWRLPPRTELQWATHRVGRSSRSVIRDVLAGCQAGSAAADLHGYHMLPTAARS